jgi:hypothetical protein
MTRRHPSDASFRAGCRCDGCVKLKRRQQKVYRVYGTRLASTEESAAAYELIRKLTSEGFSVKAIAEVAGIPDCSINKRIRVGHERIQSDAARRILTVTRQQLIDHARDTTHLPVIGARRRLHALFRLGWTLDDIAAGDQPMRKRLADISRGERTHTAARSYRFVVARFDELCMTEGPSKQTRTRATRLDYPPPLAWDDIDDPAAEPQHQLPDISLNEAVARETFRRFHEDLTELLRTMPVEEACRALGVTPRAAYDRYVKRAPNDPIRFLFTRDMRRKAS